MTLDILSAVIERHQANKSVIAPSEEQWAQSQEDILTLLKSVANLSVEAGERKELARLKGKYEVTA